MTTRKYAVPVGAGLRARPCPTDGGFVAHVGDGSQPVPVSTPETVRMIATRADVGAGPYGHAGGREARPYKH